MTPPTTVIPLRWNEIELALEQVSDLAGLAQDSLRSGTDPYWGYLWPSARALMDIVASEAHNRAPEAPDRGLAGLRVLDLGCGLGGIGVLAARLGATVTLADIRPEALDLAGRNARRNGVPAQTLLLDWSAPPDDLGTFDAICAADVLYGDGMLRGVLRFVRGHLRPGGRALIADPMRVEPAGIAGAGRLLGLSVHSSVLQVGQTFTGGVTLYEVQRGASATPLR